MQESREDKHYREACEQGKFFWDKDRSWGGSDGLTQIHSGYVILFTSWDGHRVITYCKKSELGKANEICKHLNSLGSVEKVNEYRKELFMQNA